MYKINITLKERQMKHLVYRANRKQTNATGYIRRLLNKDIKECIETPQIQKK